MNQDVQKGLEARPQRAKARRVLWEVRGGLERSGKEAFSLVQHPDRPEK